MRLAAIVAMAENRVIGRDNQLPWHLSADLQHFKQVTMSKPIVMGRKTYESIGRPLPGRHNIVISRTHAYAAPGCTVVDSVSAALTAAGACDEVMVIGGALLYEQVLPQVQRIYMTIIHETFEGDAYFPQLDAAAWEESERVTHMPDAKNPYAYSFLIYNRVNKS